MGEGDSGHPSLWFLFTMLAIQTSAAPRQQPDTRDRSVGTGNVEERANKPFLFVFCSFRTEFYG